jgi:hypothetical protein
MRLFLISSCVKAEERNGRWVCAAARMSNDVYRSYYLKWLFAQPIFVMDVQNSRQSTVTARLLWVCSETGASADTDQNLLR